jgi:hypothetical protein
VQTFPGQPQPFVPGQVARVPPGVQQDPDDDPVTDVAPDPDAPGVQRPRTPQPFLPPGGVRPAVNGQIVRPVPAPDLDNDVQPDPNLPVAPPPAAVPTNPFGVSLGSSRPGVISPVPQQPPPRPQVDPEP